MAIINFRGLYETVFKSFNVAADTELITKFEADWISKLIIIKRSWLFWLFISWKFFMMFAIMIVNIYLIYLNFTDPTVAWVLIWILVFNILYWIISVLIYFSKFRKIYWERSMIVETADIKTKLAEWDIAFTKFFNQTIFNYFILIWITGFIAYEIIFVLWFSEVWMYWWLNIFLLFVQIYISTKFKKRMLDLEMDFAVVIPWKIIFYNQSNLTRSVQTINSEKIKTITSKHAKIVWSIFNFWDITIMTEWDEANIWEMTFSYISCPSETVYEINELLGMEIKREEKKVETI